MPRISVFYGIAIFMYWNEGHHARPHFHARYGGRAASIDFDGNPIAGSLTSSRMVARPRDGQQVVRGQFGIWTPQTPLLISPANRRKPVIHPRHALVLAVALVAAAVLSIGINRIVVTDGHVAASTAYPTGKVELAFKSDYLPLER